ncbi:hypothetical protein Tco_0907492, partial [Tanacetum coccineum]
VASDDLCGVSFVIYLIFAHSRRSVSIRCQGYIGDFVLGCHAKDMVALCFGKLMCCEPDEHVFLAKDQPLPPVDSPTALSPGYVADSDPKEDSEEEHADYLADGGDDDDDDDETDDEDEEPFEEEEEEEPLDPADLSNVLAIDPVPSAEDTEALEADEPIPTPPLPPAYHTTARISIRPEAPILLPPEEEVERLLALPTPPPSPLISLSPPTAEERLARCLAAPTLPLSPLPRLPHPYGSPNHVRAPPCFRASMGRLRASSPLPPPVPAALPLTSPLPSSPLPPLPDSLFIPPVDRMEDIPKAELPPRKRLCLTTPASRYEVGESSTAVPRPTRGRRVDYGFVGTLDAEARRQRAEAVGYGIKDTWYNTLCYKVVMIQLRAEASSTSHSPPSHIILSHTRADTPPSSTPPSGTPSLLPIPLPTSSPPLHLLFTDRRADRPEVTLPPRKREIMRDLERDVGYGITDTWDEMLVDMPGAPATDDTELGRRMTEFATLVRQDTYEIYTRLDDEQIERQLMAGRLNMLYRDRRAHARTALLMKREARMSQEAWGRSMDASDLARTEVMSLRTTVLGQQAVITELQAADRRRQAAITELLAADHRRQAQFIKALKLLKALQTQMTAF